MKKMTIKHNETGRSMVEMLGVLAIMGVLSIGGVAGYRYAVDKMNANEIINELKKRAITASQQRILGQGINLSEYGVGAKIKGTYTVTPTDTYNGNASQFALEVAGVPERVCDMIIDSDWALPTEMAVNGGSCVEGANGMTFAFNNTLGSGDAENGETPDVTIEDSEQKNCSGKGTWNGSYCECDAGFGGEDCTETRDPNVCDGHGKPGEPNEYGYYDCLCDRGWSGIASDHCNIQNDLCNGHGLFNGCGCRCDGGWSGSYCDENVERCNGNGYYEYYYYGNNRCTCKTGWTGDDCSLNEPDETATETEVTETETEVTVEQTESTEPDCGEHGTWGGSSCNCDRGWTGTYCETNPDCGEHGTWDSSTEMCTCSTGWGGSLCSFALCGEHGTWDSSTQQCVCEEGWTGNTCSVEISCNGHGTWDLSTQRCVCDDGWSMASYCSAKICQHGTRTSTSCDCDDGWGGTLCSISTSCNGHGTWDSSTEKCVCEEGWAGAHCSASISCNEHGVLDGETCICNTGWEGDTCSIKTSCNGHATWDSSTQQCICDEGWTGNRCDRNTLCSGHGIWNGTSCECDKGYGGDDCSLKPSCRWSGWLDSAKPNYSPAGGDIESVVGICENGWVADISCRAAMFPNHPLDVVGQVVRCNTEEGLVCYNKDQFPSKSMPPSCLNYEINVYCCS